MNEFPIFSIHNVFDDPRKVIAASKNLTYTKSKSGHFPGVRSQMLHHVYPDFTRSFFKSLFSLFYDFDKTEVRYHDAHLYFHKMKPYSKRKSDIRNTGWIHKDECALAGLVYLNEDADPDSGTSVYKPITHTVYNMNAIQQKENLYCRGIYNSKLYKRTYEQSCSQFVQTTKINNVFNTMVCYDGDTWHKVDNFIANKNEERLTLNFFIYKLEVDKTPVQRFRQ